MFSDKDSCFSAKNDARALHNFNCSKSLYEAIAVEKSGLRLDLNIFNIFLFPRVTDIFDDFHGYDWP